MSKLKEIQLHGHRVAFREAGEGPLVVLIHGITGRSDQWSPAIDHLATEHRVLAPDLLGHGESAKPRGDYSLGAYASAVRDTIVALGHDRATIVGHSLGGGIAMQFAYQFPERCERLVLVSSGGLGREVHPLLRASWQGRNTEHGPGLKNWDVNLVKTTKIGERFSLELRGEFFNIWNTPMYGTVSVSPFGAAQSGQGIPSNVFSSPAGQFLNPTVVDGGGRVIRYPLRLHF